MEAARVTPPPRPAAHLTPPRQAARDTHLPGGGGDRGWTRWWEGGSQHSKLESRHNNKVTMETVKRSEEEVTLAERSDSPGEVKHRPQTLLHHG